MEQDDLRDLNDLNDVKNMMDTRGWQVLMVSMGAERERIIKIVAGARTKGKDRMHDWEYFQGCLAEFQNVIDIFDRFEAKRLEIIDKSLKEKEYDAQANER